MKYLFQNKSLYFQGGLALFATVLFACTGEISSTKSFDDILFEEGNEIEFESLGLTETSSEEESCFPVGGLVRTTVLSHLQDPNLVQQAGPIIGVSLDPQNRFPGLGFSTGTVVATIIGALSESTLLVNHHLVFKKGQIRTNSDPVTLTPTDDPCLFTVDAILNIEDGTGIFEGVFGEGSAEGVTDFCLGEGALLWSASLCL